MKKLSATSAIALLFVAFAVPWSAAGENAGTLAIPKSLDSLYPPVSGTPVHLFGMLELDSRLSAIVADLMEEDPAGAKGGYPSFKSSYEKVRTMVPEWTSLYPLDPVEKLGAALDAGDRARIMSAVGEVGASCHHCHLATMVPVQQRYRWGDFGALKVKDPLSGQETAYVQFKRFLSTHMAGIAADLAQGQPQSALKQYQGFKARFEGLSGTCLSCHDRPSAYYVDAGATALVGELGRALEVPSPSPETVTSLLQRIGRASCSPCHLVHVPAANAQAAAR